MVLEAILIVDSSHLQIALYPFDAHLNLLLPLFRIGGGEAKRPSIPAFSLVTSANGGISPQKLSDF